MNKRRKVLLVVVGLMVVLALAVPVQAGRPPTCPLDEDFSSWLPSGWATDDWDQSNSTDAGGTSPEAWLIFENITDKYSYLDSKAVDTTGMSSVTLEFKSSIYDYYGNHTCTVYTIAHGGDSWTDVTPWSNPIYDDVGPNTYSVDISFDIGSATQVRFEWAGDDRDAIDFWYVDDVKICGGLAPPVGGEAYPVSKASLLAPWIAVAAVLAGGTSWYALRRRRPRS